MKNIPAPLLAHYQGRFQTIAFCCLIALAKRQPRVVFISNANPGVVRTMWPHGFVDDDVVKFVGIEGMEDLNFVPNVDELYFPVTVVSSTEFSIGVDTTAFTPYLRGTSFGTARRVLGFTEFERDLIWNNVRLHARTGAKESSVDSSSDMTFSSRDIEAMLQSDQIVARDVEEGVYAGAEFETFEVNYKDLTMGRNVLQVGHLGDIAYGDVNFVAEGLGLLSMLHQNQGPLCSITCRAQFGNRITDTFDERFGCKIPIEPPEWQAFTDYTPGILHDAAIGSTVKPTVYNGFHYVATTPGKSHPTTEPTWNTVEGETTQDGAVVWRTIEARTKRGSVTAVIDTRTIQDSSRTEPDGHFTHGLFTFTSGLNAGFDTEVRIYSVGVFALRDPPFRQMHVGDTYLVEKGCNKLKRTCIDVFDNIRNFRGEPDLPGFHKQFLFPDAPT